MGKAEISWKNTNSEGEKRQVYAHHFGNQWIFYHRLKRYDEWQVLENPPLDDWMELWDGVKRRIARRLLRPEEEGRVRKLISERFPDAKLK